MLRRISFATSLDCFMPEKILRLFRVKGVHVEELKMGSEQNSLSFQLMIDSSLSTEALSNQIKKIGGYSFSQD